MIATATRRHASRLGSYYLTHGADTCDKHGKRKTQRALGQALIAEGLAELDETDELDQEWTEADELEYQAESADVYASHSDWADEEWAQVQRIDKLIARLQERREQHWQNMLEAEKEMRKAWY